MRCRAGPPMFMSVTPGHKAALTAALVAEVAIFAIVAPNFFTLGNFFEITRLNAELGLLAVALTPILITGGIDLSVGAVMGLSAVCFGVCWKELGLPIPAAVAAALAVGAIGGAINGALIARFNLPALIVTLGTFSLFRGVAEGITQAAVSYSGFPSGFLWMGQGYLWGVVPAQLPVFVAVVAGYFVLVHRSAIGRALFAIGFSGRGARYAGVPVARRIGLVYLLSGVVSSLAGVIYVAHLGQARSDAGTGYELRCDYRRGARRHIGIRRAWRRWRHRARPCGVVGVEERDAAGGAAFRSDRCIDRRAAALYDRRGSAEPPDRPDQLTQVSLKRSR